MKTEKYIIITYPNTEILKESDRFNECKPVFGSEIEYFVPESLVDELGLIVNN
jgi:hypothetical protein